MEPIVKLFLPLLSWVVQKAFGPVLPDAFWSKFALSWVPPPKNIVNTIVRESAGWDSPALLAPVYRRWVRNRCKRYIGRQLNNPSVLAVRGWLLRWRQELEARGYTVDPTRIRKLRDIEAETNDYYSSGQAQTDISGILGLGDKDRPLSPLEQVRLRDATALAWEFDLYGEGGIKPKITRNSFVSKMLNIDLEKLDAMTLEQGLLYYLSQLSALLGLNGSPPKMANLRRLFRWVVKTHLPSEREPETTLEAISKAVETGLIHKGVEKRADDTGEVVEVDVADKPSVQPEHLVTLNGRERLSQFCELAGVDMETLTAGELNRILDILNVLDAGYELASKKGVSMAAYYGDKANSEKTQRQRLFKKIREVSDKAR